MKSIQCYLASLGCAKNQVDAEVMLGLLKDKGYTIVDTPQEADILIVNTCGFIGPAKEESIDTILSLAQYKEKGKGLIVTGCLSQRYKEELEKELPEVDAFIGTGHYSEIVQAVENILQGEKTSLVNDNPSFLYSFDQPRAYAPGTSAYIKVAEGCDNCCTYCVIPAIRGSFRSRTMESILEEAQYLVKKGYKELILIAQDTTRYGEDIYGQLMLAPLLEKLAAIPGQFFLRILYCYPTRFTDELIKVIAKEDKICKYIEMPLQHGDDFILQAMHRQGTRKEITALLEKIRANIPNVALRTSFIVGFPGETTEHFNNLLDFMKEIQFDRVGIFTYSQEEGTPAGDMPNQVPEEIKEKRYHQAMQLQQKISLAKNQEWVGKTLKVLMEGPSEDSPELWIGRSFRDAPEIDGLVFVEGKAQEGEFVQIRIKQALEYDLIGERE